MNRDLCHEVAGGRLQCNACGGTDCPNATDDPTFSKCPAEKRKRAGRYQRPLRRGGWNRA